MSKGKEITTKQEVTQELTVFTSSKSMGAAEEITSRDVQIPSLMLMQANAELVKDRSNKIQSGDFVNSVTREVWGSIEEPMDLCVVDMFKTEVITRIEGNEWVSTRPWEPDMEVLPYEFTDETGKKCKRQKCFNYICIRPLDIREVQLPDRVEYIASPFVVKFKGASGKNAKKLNQLIKDMASFRYPSWAAVFTLVAREDKNEHGTFLVYDMEKKGPSLKETQLAAEKICEMSQTARKAGQFEVVDAEEVQVERTVNNIPNMAPTAKAPDPQELF